MVYIVLVQFLIGLATHAASPNKLYTEGYLGERPLDSYSERYYPFVTLDIYRGKMAFADDEFYRDYFRRYLFPEEKEINEYLKNELPGGMMCSNELLAQHYDSLRYSYRLITVSYLLEGQWHMDALSDHLGLKKACDFDLSKWLATCKPKSTEMVKFVGRLKKYSPKYRETLPPDYDQKKWLADLASKKFRYYSHYRLDMGCKGKCDEKALRANLARACGEDENLMTLICSEEDELFGLSRNPDAFQLVSGSNIINTYNHSGEAPGCLRRFSEVLSHKESRYPVLADLFPAIKSHLSRNYGERFLQGRVFFYGSGKEFEEKGMKDVYVMEQPLKVEPLFSEDKPVTLATTVAVAPKVEPATSPVKNNAIKAPEKKIEKPVAKKPVKSAFLLAAEARKAETLDLVEVDMLKLKYDHVFTLNQLNSLSQQLKTFMTREALEEMYVYDKLGSKEGPVPLLFIKYMIDMQEHTGLYNLITIIGDRFWVSNEIDKEFKPAPEYIRIANDVGTGNQWQIFILRAQ